MNKLLTSLCVLAGLALGAPSIAQTTGTDESQNQAAQSDAGQAEAPQTGTQLDLGSPADGGPKLGERYSKETFGDWDLACVKTNADTDPCSLMQLLKDGQGNAVAEFSLFRLEGAGQAVAGATVVVPLETLLTEQLTIAIDGGTGKRYAYSFCNNIGCVAQIGLTQEDVDAFKKGSKGVVSLVPAQAPDQTVSLDMSLKGFTAGFDAVDVVSN